MDVSDQRGDRLGGPAASGGLLSLISLVLAATAVVAVTTKGPWLLPPALHLGTAWTWVVRFAGLALAGAGVAGLMAQRRIIGVWNGRSADPTVVALRTAALIMGGLAVVAFLHSPSRNRDGRAENGSTIQGPRAQEPSDGGSGSSGSQPALTMGGDPVMMGSRPPGEVRRTRPARGGATSTSRENPLRTLVRLLVRILVIATLLFALVTLVLRLRLRPRAPPADMAEAGTAAQAALQASLEEVYRNDGAPRDQITYAYRRLLAALAAVDAPRRPEEAPHEHLHRVLGRLGVRPGPLHRLTELYVEAQFSRRALTDRHRADAIEALEASLADLRSVPRMPGYAVPVAVAREAMA